MAGLDCVQPLLDNVFFTLAALAVELVAAVTLRVNLAVLAVVEVVAKGLTFPVQAQPQGLLTQEVVVAVEVNCLQMAQQAALAS
jgi:hypothetical protein